MIDASDIPADIQFIVKDLFEHQLFRPWRSDERMFEVAVTLMDERFACGDIAEKYAKYAKTEHEAQMCAAIGATIQSVPRTVGEE
jgi:hypothetical protein